MGYFNKSYSILSKFFSYSMQGGIRESSETGLEHLSKDKIRIFLTPRFSSDNCRWECFTGNRFS